ncbi:MAG: 30S ribosomal protein S17 [Nitrospirae bacterium]|nr:30S ribosomal protein S17 [Nitrospirota bacterium]
MPKKVYTGRVVSDRMNKTCVVEVTRLFQHPVYKKTMKKVLRLKAHDPENACHIGDKVSVVETRPLSKDKRWSVLEVLEKA